jgi:hypothetical protein
MDCGKAFYSSFSEAEKGIRIIQSYKRDGDRLVKRRNKQKNSRPLKPYKCPDCNGWHLTSQK